jgi:hypothetical protein
MGKGSRRHRSQGVSHVPADLARRDTNGRARPCSPPLDSILMGNAPFSVAVLARASLRRRPRRYAPFPWHEELPTDTRADSRARPTRSASAATSRDGPPGWVNAGHANPAETPRPSATAHIGASGGVLRRACEPRGEEPLLRRRLAEAEGEQHRPITNCISDAPAPPSAFA